MPALIATGFGSLEDGLPLHTPIPGLFADIEVGSGSVALTDEFLEAPAAARVEILQHWTRALNLQRESALVEMFREFAGPLANLSIVEQIERFRQLCAQLGLDCPPEFAVLLQRY